MNAVPRVTVIMRSRNSAWVIAQALAGLYSQDYRKFELLIVDSGSTDNTLDIVRFFPHQLIQIEASSYFPGAVLNMAIERAQGEIIVFQNSDAVPLGPHSLGRLIAAFEDSEVQAAFGRQLPRPDAHNWVRRDYAASFPQSGEAPPWITLSLPMAAMRKSAWQERPFYTDAWASEDTEWGLWARKKGYKIAYVADCILMHSHNYTLRQLYGRRFVEGEADAFIYGDHLPWWRMTRNILRSIAGDWLQHLKAGDVLGMPAVVPRRVVYHWAYLKGLRLGESRIARGDKDASVGQKTVLARHDT